MKKEIHIAIFFLLLISLVKGYAEDSINSIKLNASFVSDIGRNFYGGIQKGNFYLGQVNLNIEIPTFAKSGFFFQLQNSHGSTPSQLLVGDLQRFSNIENGNLTYLYQAYYRQTIGSLSIIAGIHDLNTEFYVTEFGRLYLNSSFGIQPSASMNMPVSIFPKNAPGLILRYAPTNWLAFQTSVYDGDPGQLESDPYNTKHSISAQKQGLFSASEIKITNSKNEQKHGVYKLGFQYHTGYFTKLQSSDSTKGNYGIYFIADQYLKKNLGVFAQVGWSPRQLNPCELYIGCGLTILGHGKRIYDVFGLALACAILSPGAIAENANESGAPRETTLELTYKFHVTNQINIQPDVQYIFRPGGTGKGTEALIRLIRVNINF